MNNKYFILIIAVLVMAAAALLIVSLTGNSVSAQSTLEFAQFTTLSNATTDQCAYMGNQAAIYNSVDSQPNGAYFQGSCCNPMDWNHYQQQITGLKNYSGIPQIPQNPYNVSVEQAQQLLGYYNNITLSASQNATFSQAALLTDDKSWCCCQCWAWYTHAGLAKYLITQHNYSATQITNITNLEDCCGGA